MTEADVSFKRHAWVTIRPLVLIAAVIYGLPTLREGEMRPCSALAVRAYLEQPSDVPSVYRDRIASALGKIGGMEMAYKAAQTYPSTPPELTCLGLYWQSLVLNSIPGAG